MHRRLALGWLGGSLLSACGGGGGSTVASLGNEEVAATPLAPTPLAPPPPAPLTLKYARDIALWGDSMVPPMSVNLRFLYPDRQIFNGGVVGETSGQIAARAIADTAHDDWIHVYWYGHNNQRESQQIKNDIARSIAELRNGHDRFVVMALVNQAKPLESRGGEVYETILQHNRDLAAQYGDHYLDIRSHLVSRYDPNNAQDRLDHDNDVPPSTLRHDEIHLNNDGSVVVAHKLREFIDARGW